VLGRTGRYGDGDVDIADYVDFFTPQYGAERVITTSTYSYDTTTGRLDKVTLGLHEAAYGYVPNSNLVGSVDFKYDQSDVVGVSKVYDKFDRLTSITSTPVGGSPISYAYQYNSANQRLKMTLADSSYWNYTYDSLGQLSSGKRRFDQSTYVRGQQFVYNHDTIGNRTSLQLGGNEHGQNLRQIDYTANDLNQYTQRTFVPVVGIDFMGYTAAADTVTVDGDPAYRHGQYYRRRVNRDNSSSAVYEMIDVTIVPADPAEIIVDNTDPEDFSAYPPSEWEVLTSPPGFYGQDYARSSPGSSHYATFQPDLPVRGDYDLFLWWPASAAHDDHVPVHVRDADGYHPNAYYLNQQENGDRWNLLGTRPFEAGFTSYMRISGTGTTGYIVADAARFLVNSISDDRELFLPHSPESFGYDLDGNLTSDGRWTYSYDGENRLIVMETAQAELQKMMEEAVA